MTQIIQTWLGLGWAIAWTVWVALLALAALVSYIQIEPLLPARREWEAKRVELHPGDWIQVRHPDNASQWGRHSVVVWRNRTPMVAASYSDWHWLDPIGMAERAGRRLRQQVPLTGRSTVEVMPQ